MTERQERESKEFFTALLNGQAEIAKALVSMGNLLVAMDDRLKAMCSQMLRLGR